MFKISLFNGRAEFCSLFSDVFKLLKVRVSPFEFSNVKVSLSCFTFLAEPRILKNLSSTSIALLDPDIRLTLNCEMEIESLLNLYPPEYLFTPEKPLIRLFVKLTEILELSSTVIEPTFFSLSVTSCHDVSFKLLTLEDFFFQG